MYPVPEEPTLGVFVQEQVDALRRCGVEVDVFFINGRRFRRNYLTGFLRFLPQPWLKHYDLIHAHYPLTGLIARAQIRRPLIVTYHGIEVVFGWQGAVCRLLAPIVDRVIVTSQRMRSLPGMAGASVIPCGVNMDMFCPSSALEARVRLGLPQGKQLVLFCAGMRPEKRFDLVQAAVEQVKVSHPLVELVVATGLPHDAVPDYMNACDVLVLASDYEGSPTVVKEAMACNLPIVSTDVGDVREIIADTDGCYIARQEAGDIAAKLALSLSGRQRSNGRSRIEHLSLDRVAQRLITEYEAVLGGKI